MILSIPLLKQIRKLWPTHRLEIVTREGLGSLISGLHLVDEVYEIKKGDSNSYQKLIEQFKSRHFERVFSPHQSIRTASFIKKINAELKVGFKQWWNFFYFDVRINRDKNLPDALRQMSLLSFDSVELKQKIKSYSQNYSNSVLGPVPEWASLNCTNEIIAVPAKFQSISPEISPDISSGFIALFPGSVWATKLWTLEGFIKLAKELTLQNEKILILGGASENDLAEKIFKEVPQVLNYCGKTNLLESLALLKSAKAVISNDSGGQHLAAIANIPTVSIFGPTVLSIGYRPWNPRIKIVENENLKCRPCGKHGHDKCPINTHECMRSISAEQVLKALNAILSVPLH